jgi:hypothetical protein
MFPPQTLTGGPGDASQVVKDAYLSVALIRTMVERGLYLESLMEIDDVLEKLRPFQDR